MCDRPFDRGSIFIINQPLPYTYTAFPSRDQWAQHLRHAGLRVRVANNPTDIGAASTTTEADAVEFAICWSPAPSLLTKFPNLKAIQSMGAGVDSMLADPTLPRHLPLLRVIDPLMAQRMATWVLWGVINAQRRCDAYWTAQRDARWDKSIENFRNIDNSELGIGVMGAGVMGGAVVDVLTKLEYTNIRTWTRRPRSSSTCTGTTTTTTTTPGIQSFSGSAKSPELLEFVSACDVLICLLPLTPETRGILNKDVFNAMPPGSTVINAARGGHCVEADLLAALNEGHLGGAILDVFETEPLPASSSLWTHPRVRVFPHVSSMTNIETAVEQMLENREAVLEGREVQRELVVDWDAGY